MESRFCSRIKVQLLEQQNTQGRAGSLSLKFTLDCELLIKRTNGGANAEQKKEDSALTYAWDRAIKLILAVCHMANQEGHLPEEV